MPPWLLQSDLRSRDLYRGGTLIIHEFLLRESFYEKVNFHGENARKRKCLFTTHQLSNSDTSSRDKSINGELNIRSFEVPVLFLDYPLRYIGPWIIRSLFPAVHRATSEPLKTWVCHGIDHQDRSAYVARIHYLHCETYSVHRSLSK